jgi:hypothetical protein
MAGFIGDLFGLESPPPPDYTPVAQASEETARIAAATAADQLAEGKRQYDLNLEIARPVADAQKKAMDQAYEQGNYNFENFKAEGRPMQQAMRDIALGKVTPELQTAMDKSATEGVADVTAALDSQRLQTNRSMTRMGVNPNSGRFAAMQGVMDVGAATAKASAANNGRTQAIDKTYARSGDVLNTYSGLASSAPTFYQAGTQAGNSATANQMAPGGALVDSMSRSAGTLLTGRQNAMSGLTGILNNQSSLYQAGMNNQAEMMGAVIGAGGRYAASSDRRLKEGIELVGRDEATGLNLYEFAYINGDGRRYCGVMADEVELKYPAAVARDESGFASVDYGLLGIDFKEVA